MKLTEFRIIQLFYSHEISALFVSDTLTRTLFSIPCSSTPLKTMFDKHIKNWENCMKHKKINTIPKRCKFLTELQLDVGQRKDTERGGGEQTTADAITRPATCVCVCVPDAKLMNYI